MKDNETDIERAYNSLLQSPPEETQAEVALDNRSFIARLWDNHPYLISVILGLLGLNAFYNVFKYQHIPEYSSIDPSVAIIVYIVGLVVGIGLYDAQG